MLLIKNVKFYKIEVTQYGITIFYYRGKCNGVIDVFTELYEIEDENMVWRNLTSIQTVTAYLRNFGGMVQFKHVSDCGENAVRRCFR